MRKKIKKVGGSLSVHIPRDVAAAMNVKEDSDVDLQVVGRSLVVEPTDDAIPEHSFRRAFATVLRRRGSAFKWLADFDAGRASR